MKILIEGENYPIEILNQVFDDPKFYTQNGSLGKITSVGYYHSYENKELVYMLPKVFMQDGEKTVFDISKETLFDFKNHESFKHKEEYNWIRQLLILFYKSLTEYQRRIKDTSIVDSSFTYEMNSNLGDLEYSYLDLLLSFVNFYKKNKNTILYKHIEYKSNQAKKPKWEKTIRKSLPILDAKKQPIYIEINNKKIVINQEEELLVYFFSILNKFNDFISDLVPNLDVDGIVEMWEDTVYNFISDKLPVLEGIFTFIKLYIHIEPLQIGPQFPP